VDSKEVEPAARKPMTEPVYQIAMAEGSASTAWIDVAKDVFDDAGMYPEYKRRALYARPEPVRKPMTEEYINAVAKAKGLNRLEAHFFLEGIRFAEKHHGITDADL
jgi:dTDP-4-dehydrorhamnose reductase